MCAERKEYRTFDYVFIWNVQIDIVYLTCVSMKKQNAKTRRCLSVRGI